MTAFLKDADGLLTDEAAGSFTKELDANGNTTGYKFKPFKDVNGAIGLQYVIADGNGNGLVHTLDLDIAAINDGPELGELPETGLIVATINEDEVTQLTAEQLIAGFYDPDNVFLGREGTAELVIAGNLVESPNGTVVFDDNTGLYTFTPDANFSGSTELAFTIQDADGAAIEVSKFVVIDAVNDAPTINLSQANDADGSNAATKTIYSVASGTQRFFSLGDFGYLDIEGTPLASITITAPDAAIGKLFRGSGEYASDGIDLKLTNAYDDASGTITITREEIEGGQIYFAPTAGAIGKTSAIEFSVSDGQLDSNDLGRFEFKVIGAPKSADETIRDAQYKAEFELIIGPNRYEAIKPVVNAEGVTLDEAVEILGKHQDEQNDLDPTTTFTYVELSEAEFRWQVGWLRVVDGDGNLDIADLDATQRNELSAFVSGDLTNDALAQRLTTAITGETPPAAVLVNAVSTALNGNDTLDTLYRSLVSAEVGLVNADTDVSAFNELLIRSAAITAYAGNDNEAAARQAAADSLTKLLSKEDAEDVQSIREAFEARNNEKKASIGKVFGEAFANTTDFTAEELARLNEISELVGDAEAEEIQQASTYAKSTEFQDLKSTVTDENGVFDASALAGIPPETAKQLALADLQAQVTEAAKQNASLSKAMNGLLAAAVSVDPNLSDASVESARLLELANTTRAASENLSEAEFARIEALQAQLEADYAAAGSGEVSQEDMALIIVNARKFTPQAISKGGTGSETSITRVDTAVYSATDKDSEMYIAPMDGSYIKDGEVFYFNTDNPSANKFVISNFIDEDIEREGDQTTYVINYTAGVLATDSNGKYTFSTSSASPSLVGFGLEDVDTALKYVSEADLENYGATAVSGAIGERTFDWGTTPETSDGEPLKDLDGNIITRAGWYDFTRRTDDGDGGQFIYGTFDDGEWSVSLSLDPDASADAVQRVLGLELKFTDNMFGDKDPTIGMIVDPFGTGQATGSEAELQAARSAEGKAVVDPDELSTLRHQAQILATSTILKPGQKAVDANAVQGPSEAVEQLSIEDFNTGNSFALGFDDPGVGDGFAAMSLGDGVGSGSGDGSTDNTSNSSGSGEGTISQQINNFLEGEGEAEGQGAGKTQGAGGDAQQAGGQGADGQGQGEGGEAALGEDQSPSTQRKRGLLLQPIVQNSADQDETQSSSRLLKNLSEGSVLGNNLLDALTLGGGILYALYAPQLVQTSRNSFRTFLSSLQKRINGGTVVIPEKNVASVFVMKRPDGTERLVAARVTASAIDIIAQQDLPSGVSVLQSGTQTQIDYGMKQLLSRIGGSSFDLLLIGPRLSNQATLTQSLSSDVQVLDTSGIESRLRTCSEAEVTELRQWLDKPSSTPLDKNPLNDLLTDRQTSMETMLKKEQASMAGLLELSIALSWKESK